MIKPTRYDDDGYPVQWVRSLIPSNSLASVNALATDCKKRRVLGPDVEIKLTVCDETNRRIPVSKIIKQARREGCTTLIGLVGVQSNQFPRAVDLAQMFLTAGLPVIIGGFHTAGCISMLPELPDEIKAAQDMGLCIFAGEAEDQRLDEVFVDAYGGELKPIYNYLNDLPDMEAQPTPFLGRELTNGTLGNLTSFDLGRDCPFQCSFCTIINVQGRKSRFRTPDDLEKIIRQNATEGVDRFFITDDNFARNRDWEALLDRMIWLQEDQGIHIDAIIQVDTLCHKLPNFIEKAARAGVNKVFIGLENINPDNLLEAPVRTIVVSGSGEASAVPDQAQVSAGVVSQAATANAALDANTEAVARVFDALSDAGIEDRNIRTSNFSVSPQYEPYRQDNPEQRRIIGYQVSNQVTAIVEEIDALGRTLDALVRSGANQLNGISFSISDPKPLEEEARRGAVLDAIAKARTLADAADVTLGKILSIQEGGGGYQPPGPMFMRAEAMSASSVPVAPGESTVSIGVSITYAIQ
ncbi:MAG: SIMPL domain-containing protein [Alphaproteobacteria bacterium]